MLTYFFSTNLGFIDSVYIGSHREMLSSTLLVFTRQLTKVLSSKINKGSDAFWLMSVVMVKE